MAFLLVHGLGLSSRIWNHLSPCLDQEAIALDLPGHGESNSIDFTWSGIWQTIANSMEWRKWSETILVLHSFSACLLPELVSLKVQPKKIIMIEGILHPKDALWSSDLTLLNNSQYDYWLKRFRSVSEIALRSQLFSKQEKKDIKFWSDAFKHVNSNALYTMSTNLKKRLGSDELLEAIKLLSNLIIYLRGERSRLSQEGRTFLENNSIEIREIPGTGHFPMIDDPIAIKKCIDTCN